MPELSSQGMDQVQARIDREREMARTLGTDEEQISGYEDAEVLQVLLDAYREGPGREVLEREAAEREMNSAQPEMEADRGMEIEP